MEEERLRKASEFALSQWQVNPEAQNAYLVSFAQPVRAEKLFESLAGRSGISLDKIYLWMAVPESVHPATAWREASYFGWPEAGVSEAAERLQEEAVQYLRQSLRRARRVETAESIRQQEAAIKDIEAHGVAAFGMECACSLTSLLSVSSTAFLLKAVEPVGLYQQPIWPEDRLRELIIETGGRYGRG